MKKTILLLCAVFLAAMSYAFAIAPAPGCCVIEGASCAQGKCTFWDMSGWERGQEFCDKLELWDAYGTTHWYDLPCDTSEEILAIQEEEGFPEQCKRGYDIPEFTTITASLALAGASVGYLTLRRKKK